MDAAAAPVATAIRGGTPQRIINAVICTSAPLIPTRPVPAPAMAEMV